MTTQEPHSPSLPPEHLHFIGNVVPLPLNCESKVEETAANELALKNNGASVRVFAACTKDSKAEEEKREPGFLFFKSYDGVRLLNVYGAQLPTLYFSGARLFQRRGGSLEIPDTETFQIKFLNNIAIQFGVAIESEWIKGDQERGQGIGDHGSSVGFNPRTAEKWHQKKCATYGEVCEIGDTVRCAVTRSRQPNGRWNVQISYSRIRGQTTTHFGPCETLNDLDDEQMRGLVPGLSMVQFQCLHFPDTPSCTLNLAILSEKHEEIEQTTPFLAYDFIPALYGDYCKPKKEETSEALHIACIMQNKPLVKKIVKPNLLMAKRTTKHAKELSRMVKEYLKQQDRHCGYTPLHMCIIPDAADILLYLLKHLTDEDLASFPLASHNLTLVHVASRYGALRCLQILLSRLPLTAANQEDESGCTPLAYALVNDHPLCAELLIRYGAELRCGTNKEEQDILEHIPLRTDPFLLLLQHQQRFAPSLEKMYKYISDPFLKSLLKPDTPLPVKKTLKFLAIDDDTKELEACTVRVKYGTISEVQYHIARARRLLNVRRIASFSLNRPLTHSAKGLPSVIYPTAENMRKIMRLEDGLEPYTFNVCMREKITHDQLGLHFDPIVPN